ncbi:PAS domain S-box protein [Sphingomonas lenta]|uniref:histidine kinase n=1 Tax=Sphingomonas lenta TaxID=1141887 RepID=A0A2A2SHU7_9SPHN|nr:PAS domain S-box protein [Sphingomonas lenta]PAX08847.1 histidine kinase [Sphingomonas lenta]
MSAFPSRVARWWADRPLATKGLVVVAVPLLALIAAIVALTLVGRAEARAEQDVRLTIAIQTDVHEVHALLAEAASGVRGYLLTGEPRFLSPYVRAEAALPAVLDRLRGRIRDRQAAERLRRIERLTARKRAGLAALREARGAGGPAILGRADILQALTANKAVLDALRLEIALMQDRERELLAERRAQADAVHRRGLLVTGLTGLVGLAGSLFAVFLFSSGIVRRVQRLERDAVLLARGEAVDPAPPARDEVGQLAARLAEASALLRAREQALRDSEERFRLVVEGVRDYGIFALDPDGIVTSWNAGAERIKGWTADEILGRHFSVFYPEDQRAERPARNLAEAAANGRAEDEGWRVRKDGSRFWANVVITALRDEAGTLRGFSKITRDITERRRAEEALDAARLEAEEASAAKSAFLSRMSHELRTPLNAILGFAQLLELEGDALPPGQRAAADQILRAGRHLLTLIDEVLDIARIEAGKLPLDLEPVPLDVVIAEAVSLSGPQARGRAVSIEVADATGATVLADRRRLLQVLLNLLSNAVKYNRDGGRVAVAVERRDGEAQVAVTDTGLGVEPAVAGRLFRPFERLGEAARTAEGTGLGLALSRSLVEAMGGAIGWKPRPDGAPGACFWFRLPLAADVVAPARSPEPATPAGFDGRGRTILLIEDNLANAELIEALAARCWPDVRLLAAMQARIGLAMAREHRPDLVLLDLHLPDESGAWVLDRLRAEMPTVPVLLLTADAPAARADWRARGARAVLTKPVDLGALIRAAEELLAEEPA